jgi:hypothetical protein
MRLSFFIVWFNLPPPPPHPAQSSTLLVNLRAVNQVLIKTFFESPEKIKLFSIRTSPTTSRNMSFRDQDCWFCRAWSSTHLITITIIMIIYLKTNGYISRKIFICKYTVKNCSLTGLTPQSCLLNLQLAAVTGLCPSRWYHYHCPGTIQWLITGCCDFLNCRSFINFWLGIVTGKTT